MILVDVLNAVQDAYDPAGLTRLADYATSAGNGVSDRPPSGDTLALFLVSELDDCRDDDGGIDLDDAVDAVRTAITELERVIAALDQLRDRRDTDG